MSEFNQGRFHQVREMQRNLEESYKEFGEMVDEDGFLNPNYELINDFGRAADTLFKEANKCKEAHNDVLRNAKISDKKKDEYTSLRDKASEIAYQVKRLYNQNINDNTLIGNDSESDRYLLDGFEINKQ